ncbi:hypothetical protein E2F50_06605 [Rhizobium deserti]|uniref:Uncharacterized protein n=1 Tax=Rhizobium deserti TaxID=2547961 RepID=A0A4R5UIE5_9HYPH|nr:hypothetical protein [Rhizobium deserti]TDK36597.1 hypothetical protein E2F50_06605 [Rhizobium deserti]
MNNTIDLNVSIMLPWRFEIGQRVQFLPGDMLATIRFRSRTAIGHETYEVRLADENAERPVRHIRGQYLKAA